MGLFSGLFGFLSQRSANRQQARAHADNREDRAIERYNASPEGIRKNAEAAGFNPLAFVGAPNFSGVPSNPVFGNALGHLGQGIDGAIDAVAERKMRITELEQENRRLEILAEKHNLKPKVAGIYGNGGTKQRGETGGTRTADTQDLSGRDGSGRISLGNSNWVAPGRELEIAPYSSGSGLTEISNRFGTIIVPGSDGEPWGIDEVATALFAGVPQYMINYFRRGFSRSGQRRADRLMDEWFRRSREGANPHHLRWGRSLPRSIAPTQREIDRYRLFRNATR